MAFLDLFRKNSGAKAKKQLEAKGLSFTEDAFLKAVMEGRTADVSLFLEAGMNPNTKGADGISAIVHAIANNHGSITAAIGKAGADVNVKDTDGRSLLVLSIFAHQEEAAKALITSGANVDARDNAGFSVVMLAVKEGQVGITEALINAGADINVKNHATGESALVMAAQRGNLPMVELLLKNAITAEDRNAPDKTGASPLWWAARNGHAEVVRMLCDKKADVNLANAAGQTPLQAAGNDATASILKEFGAR